MDEQRAVLLLMLLSLSAGKTYLVIEYNLALAGKIFYLSYDIIISLLLLKSREIYIMSR